MMLSDFGRYCRWLARKTDGHAGESVRWCGREWQLAAKLSATIAIERKT
jgi:hypothetical protein